MKEYVIYNIIKGEHYLYQKFSTMEDALRHAVCIAKKHGASLEIWKGTSPICTISASGIDVIF